MIIRWTPVTKDAVCPPMGDELEKHIDEYGSIAARTISCSAWWLLYRTLLEIGEEPGHIAFGNHGKPYFSNRNIHFSVSHSKNLCSVAIANCPVGIDIELCQRKYSKGLYVKSLTGIEKKYYSEDFIKAWCRKESIAKLTGRGLDGYPEEIDTLNNNYRFIEDIVCYESVQYRITVAIQNQCHLVKLIGLNRF